MAEHIFLRGAFFSLALSVSVFAQGRAGSSNSGPTNFPGSSGTIGNTSPNFPNNFPGTTSPNEVRPPLYLSGKVVMDDGTPPPDRVAIQLVCRGTPRTITFTDRKGFFSADVNDRRQTSQFEDASERNSGFGGNGPLANNNARGAGDFDRDLLGCDLRANLAGFRSDVYSLGARRSLDNPDVGTLFLRRLANVDGLTISATSALAPKDAVKAFDKGREAEAKQKWPDALKEFDKAVSLYPKYAAAWCELGNVQQQQKDVAGARQSYAKALEADPKFVSPYLQLGELAGQEQKWQEAADDTDHLLKLNPIDFPQAWLLNAIANYNLHKFDIAEKSARELLTRDSTHQFPKANLLLGVLLAQKQSYLEAAQNLRDYLHYAPKAEDAEQVKKQLADVEKVLGPEAKQQ